MESLLNAIDTESLLNITKIIKTKNISLENNALNSQVLLRAFVYERKDVVRFLLKHYCHVDVELKTYSFTTTPLHCAIKLRDVWLVSEILQKNPSFVADSDGNTALHLAFLHKFEEAVDLILTHIEQTSRYIGSKNEIGLSHMHIACTRRNKNVIRGFLKTEISLEDSVNVNSPCWSGYTALHFASEFKSLEAFRVLTAVDDEEVIVEEEVDNTKTPLSPSQIVNKHLDDLLVMAYFSEEENEDNGMYFDLACIRKNRTLLKKFIHNGAGVDYEVCHPVFNTSNGTPLHIAVECNLKDTVKLLLQYDADIETTNRDSMTALHLALYEQKDNTLQEDSIIDLLYNKTVNKDTALNVEDQNGLGYFEVAITRNDFEMVKKFLDKGLDVNKLIKPNQKKYSHYTPLHFAILYNHKEMAELLIKHGSNIDLTGEENMNGTPLHMAFDLCRKDLIELLLKNGANTNVVRSVDGYTILHSLTEQRKHGSCSLDEETIVMYMEQMVKLGAEVNAQDKNGDTALHYIGPMLETQTARFCLLLELGADINLENYAGDLPFHSRRYSSSLCNTEENLIIYHHVQKLKALGLYVHPKNDEFCKRIEEDWKILEPSEKASMDNKLACSQQQRLDEIATLKNIMITSSMSLYNFLKLEQRRVAAYMPNNVLKKILEDEDFDKKYPSYGYLIRLQCRINTNDFLAKHPDKRTLCSETDKESHPPKRQRLE